MTSPFEEPLKALPEIPLRTHVALFSIILLFFATAAAFTLWLKSEDEQWVEASFQRDLKILTTLPRLEAALRRGNVPRARSMVESLPAVRHGGQISELLSDLDEQLNEKSDVPGGAPSAERRMELYSLVSSIGHAAATDLDSRKAYLENAGLRRFFARTAFEVVGAAFIGFYLFYFIVTPTIAFERSARQWRLGQAWASPPMPAIPEMRSLMTRFSQMAERLNAQYGHERELNEFKTKLVSLISHDFNNSLTIIRNATYLLEEASSAESNGNAKYLRMIKSHTKALNAEVNNLLSLARIEAGKLAVNPSKTDAEAILRGAIELFSALAEDKRLTVEVELPELLAPVRADPGTLGLVVNNLLSNAIKYTPEKGTITLGIAPEAGRPEVCRVFVRDTGIGISPEDRDKILRGYYRTERGNKLSSKGFGIGLSLARQIIEAHGSELELHSELGKGTTFSFLLPIWKET